MTPYSDMSLADLKIAYKKARQNELFSAGFIGFLIGVMTFGLVRKGFGWVYVFIPLILIGGISRNWVTKKKEKDLLLEEIKRREAKPAQP